MKRVLLTGASSGIGRASCRLLLERGFEVIGTSRSVEAHTDRDRMRWLPLDLRSAASIDALAEATGEIDFLVNNAGKAYLSSLIDGDPAEWDEMLEVNVRGLARVTRALLPKLKAGGGVINISSLSGHRVPPSGGFYAPTKFAVRALTESLRLELRARGSSLRVGSISPGFVDTALLDDYFKGREGALEQLKEGGQMLQSEDVARALLTWLESPVHVEFGDMALRSVGQTL